MSSPRREVLRGTVQHRKKGTAQWKKRTAVAHCGGSGGAIAQVELFDDIDDGGAKGKPKRTIPLVDAKIDTLSPPSTPSDSSPQGSVVSGTSPRSAGLSPAANPNKFEFHITSGTEQHEFKCESEEDTAAWVKLLGLLVLFPQAYIPEEPKDNPIKDSFRIKWTTKDFKADSVWPIYILPEEVSLRLNIIGLHILVLRGGVPNQTVGTLEIISPVDNNPVVTWERDKLRRTGKTGNLVFVEIGRRCKGGPGLVWLYTGVEQAQSLRETLHNFLFHGDGKAIGMPVQQKQIYDPPKPSVDSLPPSYHRRSSASTSSGYHSQPNITSPTSTSGSPSVRSETTLPIQPAGRIGRQISAPCDINPTVPRRSTSQPNPSSTYTYHTPRSSCHSDDPVFEYSLEDIRPSCPDGALEQESVDGPLPSQRRSASMPSGSSFGKGHIQNRCHTTATCQVPKVGTGSTNGGGDEYEVMIHPLSLNRSLYKESDYVCMHSAQSPANRSNYDYVPPVSSLSTITEVERPTPYENHPLPQDLQNVATVNFQPKYENVEAARKSKVGSVHSDTYENVLANGDQLETASRNSGNRIYENLQEVTSNGLHYLQVGVRAKGEGIHPSVTKVNYNTIDLNSTSGIQTLQRERSMQKSARS